MILLVSVVWIAFVQEKTPLNLLRWWFWIEADAWVLAPQEAASEAEKAKDVEEKIEDIVWDETTEPIDNIPMSTGSTNTWNQSSSGDTSSTSQTPSSPWTNAGALSEADKKAARDLIDALIIE